MWRRILTAVAIAAALSPFVFSNAKADTPQLSLNAIEETGCAPYRPTKVSIPACSKLIADTPNLPEPYAIRGNAYRLQEKFELALKDLDKALTLRPGLPFALSRRIWIRRTNDPADDALKRSNDEARVLGLTSDDPRVLETRGMVQYRRRKPDLALAELDRALNRSPDDLLIRQTRLLVLQLTRQWDDILAGSETLLKRVPDSPLTLFSRGHALSALNRRDEAIEAYKLAMEADPEVKVYAEQYALAVARKDKELQKRQPGPMAESKKTDTPFLSPGSPAEKPKVDNAISVSGPNRALAAPSYFSATTNYEARKYRAAISDLDNALSRDPNFEEALLLRSQAYLKLNEFSSALRDVDLLLSRNPLSFQAHTLRGELRARQGKWKEAIIDLERALELRPGHSGALAGRGWVKLKKGDEEAGKRDLDAALAIDPTNATALFGLADYELGNGKRARAISLYQQILSADPNNIGAREALERARSFSPKQNVSSFFGAAMRVKLVKSAQPDCANTCATWISAEGFITDDTPEQLEDILDELGDNKVPIFLSSAGGSVKAGIKIGEAIRKRGLDVVVSRTEILPCTEEGKACNLPHGIPAEFGAHCESACVLVLAGGAKRLVADGIPVGVHTPYRVRNGGFEQGQLTFYRSDWLGGLKAIRAHYRKMGISETLGRLTEEASKSSMRYLTREELISTKLSSEETSGEQLIARLASPNWPVDEQRSAASAARAAYAQSPSP